MTDYYDDLLYEQLRSDRATRAMLMLSVQQSNNRFNRLLAACEGREYLDVYGNRWRYEDGAYTFMGKRDD